MKLIYSFHSAKLSIKLKYIDDRNEKEHIKLISILILHGIYGTLIIRINFDY